MSIRLRLTIWYTAVLAIVLALFSLGIYVFTTWQMLLQVDSRLVQAGESVPTLLLRGGDARRVDDAGRTVFDIRGFEVFQRSDLYAQLIRNNGSIFGVSPNIADANLSTQLDPVAFSEVVKMTRGQHGDLFTEAQHEGTPPIRVMSKPIFDNADTVAGVVQVGTSLESIKAAQRSLLAALVGLGTLGTLFSAVIGALLARRAFRPVDDLTKTAMAIYHADNLDQRVAVPAANDEIGRLSQAFNEMLDRLARLFGAQQRLVADVSHEMRTPLTVIRGNVDLLRAMGCADQESLDALTRESDRMTRLVGDLLLLSQADAGVLPMQFQAVALNQVISDVERSGQVLAASRVAMVAEAEPGLSVQADPDRLKQVLLNLVDNAIKHTPDGGTVTLAASPSYNGFIRIAVSDTGIGIPEQDIPYVFERFYRVDKSRSRANGGSGLGLSIARSIVEAHHGRIVVSSRAGQGTTFDVYLPVAQPGPAAQMRDSGREAQLALPKP